MAGWDNAEGFALRDSRAARWRWAQRPGPTEKVSTRNGERWVPFTSDARHAAGRTFMRAARMLRSATGARAEPGAKPYADGV